MKERVLSGIRPTGKLHLGNYFGAVKSFVELQKEYDCFFFIADYHALTTHPKASQLSENSLRIVAEYLACGLNPKISAMYLQSDLPQTFEVYLAINMFAYLGELERCPTFKEKARTQPNNVNAGLLTYPTLMAADILIHRAHKVPVGGDQKNHIEMTRDFAKRFNRFYNKEVFTIPKPFSFSNELMRIPGLDGKGKMSKSEGNAIYLSDNNDTIKKTIKRSVTDSGPSSLNEKKSQPIQNLFDILNLVAKPSVVKEFEDSYNQCTIRYGDLKTAIIENTVSFVAPIRERINLFWDDKHQLLDTLKDGAERAQENANILLSDLRKTLGFKN